MQSDRALPLTWLPGPPIWVDQWPLSKEKLHIVEALVKEQFDQGHIEYSTITELQYYQDAPDLPNLSISSNC